jgi:hypothetical protein
MAVQWYFFYFTRNNSIIKCQIRVHFFLLKGTFWLTNTDDPSPKLIWISKCLLYFHYKNQECTYNIAHRMPVSVWSFYISILVVVLKRRLTVSISFLFFQDTCQLVTSYRMITRVQFMARGMNFSLSHHVQPGRGANPVFSPVSFFPSMWSCQNMKHTPHTCTLRGRFLHWLRRTINNISNIVSRVFSMSTLQKLCKVMPYTPLQGLMMDGIYKVTCMYNSWGKDRIHQKLCTFNKLLEHIHHLIQIQLSKIYF